MKAKASVIAQKLLNLYRQAHVIVGGWAAVNRVFVAEATQDVLQELRELPTGKMLVAHIANLRDGTTPMDSIARNLLPYGGMMAESVSNIELTAEELKELTDAINEFTPTKDGLDKFMENPVIVRFGAEWISATKNVLAHNSDALIKLDTVIKTWTAYEMWDSANEILSNPITDRVRAQVQVDMPEYETYLPMFGAEGEGLLNRLRTFVSSMPEEK